MGRPVSLIKWLFLPPIVAIPTILVVRSLGSPLESGPVDASLWGLIGLLFITLTALYALFILHIDASSARDLAALIQRWNAEGRTIVSVLHDLEHVRRDYPQTLLLAREAVAWGATAEVLSEDHLARARRLNCARRTNERIFRKT